MQDIWLLISSLALVLLIAYLIGATSRLSRVRLELDEKFRVLEKTLAQQLDIMNASVDEADEHPEDAERQERLKQALVAFDTYLKEVSGKLAPHLSLPTIEEANKTLDLAWRAYVDQGADLVGSPLPEEMLQAWRDCAVLTTSAQQSYNKAVDEYNASCGLIPAHYLALLRKMPKAYPLQLAMNSHIEDSIKSAA